MNIVIKDFPVTIRLGYFPEEQKNTQAVLVSLNAELFDESSAGKQDDLRFTVDYARLFSAMEELLAMRDFKLVEAAVWCLGDGLIKQFPVLKSLHIEIVKQHIPSIKTNGARVSVSHLFRRA